MSNPELTPRQRAARLNRAKRGPLGDEARELLRVAAHLNKPWLRTTGPRTAAGKARSRANAMRHGSRAKLLVPDAVRQAEEARLEGRQVPTEAGWEAVAFLAETGTVQGLVRAARIVEAMGPTAGAP